VSRVAGGTPARVAVLASGEGTTFEALVEALRACPAPVAEVVLAVAGRPGAGVLARAERLGIAGEVVPRAEAGTLGEVLDSHEPDLVVLAGYLSLVPADVVRRYAGRMLNVHPGLLPAFGGPGMYGRRVHEEVIEAGCRVSGVTVHLVDEAYDSGPILAQWPVPVMPDDDAARLEDRVRATERRLLPRVVELLAGAAPGDPAGEHFDLAAEPPGADALVSTARTSFPS
jgi:phosphoribosylglycinamide formyltransferase 1